MTKHLHKLLALLVLAFSLSAHAQSDVTTVFNNDFSEFTNGSEETPGTTDLGGYSGALYKSTKFPGWNGSKVYEAGEKLLIGDNGKLTTARYNFSANSGIFKVSLKLRAKDSYGGLVTIQLGTFTTLKQIYLTDNKWTDISFVASGGRTSSQLQINAQMTLNGVLIDDFKVEQSASFLPSPTAKQPTIATKTYFYAQWSSVSGATYLLDVYTKNASGDKEYFLQNESVTTTTLRVEGLDATKQYYFTVRAQKGDAISDPSDEIRVVPVVSEVTAPVATEASNISANGFTANWNAVEDAAYYTVSLYKHTVLSESKEVSLLYEDFSKVTKGTLSSCEYPSSYGNLDEYTFAKGWSQSQGALAAGYMGISPYSGVGYIQTPALDLSSNNGAFTVECEAAVYYGAFVTGDSFKIQLITDDDDETVLEEKSFDITEAKFATFKADFTKGATNTYIRFSYTANGFNKIFFDNIRVSQLKPAGSDISSLIEVVTTEKTSEDFKVTFGEGEYYTYSVTASVETVVGSDIDYLDSPASNVIKVADPSSVDAVETENANVYASNGAIEIYSPSATNVEVYSITGALIRKGTVAAGNTTLDVTANGVVLVKVGNKTFKVIL